MDSNETMIKKTLQGGLIKAIRYRKKLIRQEYNKLTKMKKLCKLFEKKNKKQIDELSRQLELIKY